MNISRKDLVVLCAISVMALFVRAWNVGKVPYHLDEKVAVTNSQGRETWPPDGGTCGCQAPTRR
jgi:hypothetical protein